MSMYSLLRNNCAPSEQEIEEAFHGMVDYEWSCNKKFVTSVGNLCRCTGYRAILDGYKTFGSSSDGCSRDRRTGGGCCKDNVRDTSYSNASQLFDPSEFSSLDPSQELIFPAKLKVYLHVHVRLIQEYFSSPGFDMIERLRSVCIRVLYL